MASPRRQQNPSLVDALFARPYDFDFHQAIKILELLDPDATPLGEGTEPTEEAVTVASHVSMAFPPSDLQAIEQKGNASPKLIINFLSLAGLVGPLPEPYAYLVLERIKKRDYALRDFLDLFVHRLASLHHRVRKKHWIGVSDLPSDETLAGKCLADLAGLGTGGVENRLNTPDRTFQFYAGLYWSQNNPSKGLERMLAGYFNVPLEVHPFTGRWFYFSQTQWPILGGVGAQNRTLGEDAVLGTKAWIQDAAFSLRVGPMGLHRFRDFLRGGRAYGILRDMVKLYVDIQQDYVLNLVIKGPEIPPTHLNGTSALGWTSWLKTQDSPADDAQVWVHP